MLPKETNKNDDSLRHMLIDKKIYMLHEEASIHGGGDSMIELDKVTSWMQNLGGVLWGWRI
jgi:hypothetical protein